MTAMTGPSQAAVVPEPVSVSAAGAALSVTPIGSYETGVFDESAAEIVEHYAPAQRLLVVNAAQALVEVLDVSDASTPTKLFDVQTTDITASDGSTVPAGAVANSVAVRADGLGVIAVEAPDATDPGWLVFFDSAGGPEALGAVRVGALPDMVELTPDGARAVVANEGEPAEDYSVDPEGSISVVALPDTVRAPAQSAVRTATFHAYEAAGARTLPAGARVFGGRADAGTGTPLRPVSENLEPEYVAIDQQSKTAWVTLQEANAVAVVDLRSASVDRIWSTGSIDRSVVPFDASDRDGAVNIRTWPVTSFRMPDTIASYQVRGRTYLVTANEGDSRDWSGYSEVSRVKDLGKSGTQPLCASVDPALKADAQLGRLNVTTANGLRADGACYERLHTFGGRGFSVWTGEGDLVFDSGAELERITAEALPTFFNSNHTESGFDGRSDDKGPEPEGVTLGKVGGRTYAFLGLERVGGVMVYDVTDPARASFVTYVNNRDFAFSGATPAAGDLGPEGLTFIAAEDSPTGRPLVGVGNEVSGATTLLDVRRALR
ncbi:alkaline phosphatase [Nocardioides sp. Soil777]|nr:alkaline phosphatase [Nocardioides sp. Soil777]